MVVSDFNIIRDASKKLGGTVPLLGRMNDFNSCIEDAGLMECHFIRSKYI